MLEKSKNRNIKALIDNDKGFKEEMKIINLEEDEVCSMWCLILQNVEKEESFKDVFGRNQRILNSSSLNTPQMLNDRTDLGKGFYTVKN